MRVEARLFEIVTGFFFLSAIIYAVTAREPVGITALTLTGGLTLIMGTYFRFVSRRVRMRPEDDPEAEISDGAGDLGFFSPGSYWPIGLAFGIALAGVALAYFLPWLIMIATVVILLMVAGMVFEYHVGPDQE